MSSTENQQNGTATAQTNGLKTNALSGTGLSSARSTTNSSFLYSSNSLLNSGRLGDKTMTMSSSQATRQAPPPTLPKYTSSFNAGSNGTAGDRLSRDREGGGSHRLASLDRLALRQRILDGESINKTNGDANLVRRSYEHARVCVCVFLGWGAWFCSRV